MVKRAYSAYNGETDENIKLSLVYKGNVAEESSHVIELIEDSVLLSLWEKHTNLNKKALLSGGVMDFLNDAHKSKFIQSVLSSWRQEAVQNR